MNQNNKSRIVYRDSADEDTINYFVSAKQSGYMNSKNIGNPRSNYPGKSKLRASGINKTNKSH